jgi:hypothetical protein
MQLIDIILSLNEETAAEEAKRIGLSYMGFGRWGKDNKVTHITKNKRLQKVRTSRQEKPAKSQPSVRIIPPEIVKPTASGQEMLKKKQPEITKDIVDTLTTRVPKSPSVSEVSQGVTTSLGRRRPVKVQEYTFMNKLMNLLVKWNEGTVVSAVYNPKDDTISMSNTDEKFPADVDRWDDATSDRFTTIIHESIHATSPRVRHPDYFNDPVAQMLEEGLTESIARRTVSEFKRQKKRTRSSKETFDESYEAYVRAINMVIKESRGRITHRTLMRTKTPEELKQVLLPEMEKITTRKLGEVGFDDGQIERYKSVIEKTEIPFGMSLMESMFQKITTDESKSISLEDKLKLLDIPQEDIDFILNGK